MSEIIKHAAETGPCIVDIDVLEKEWDHRFMIHEAMTFKPESPYHFRLIKYTQGGHGECDLKVTISEEQAVEIIERLNLVRTTDTFFKSMATWRPAGVTERDAMEKINGGN